MWLWMLLACSSPAPDAVSTVHWGLDWKYEDASIADDGVRVHTDQGFEVHIEEGWLVNYSAALVPCPEADPQWTWWMGAARAAHAYEDDPSAIEPQFVEALHAPTRHAIGTRTMEAGRYCQTHLLWARARADASVPRDDLIGRSLRLRGTYDDGSGPQPLEIDASWAHANQRPITLPDQPTGTLKAVATRDLDHLFDGIDFRTANPNQVAWRVLDNLADQTRWDLEWQP